MSQGLKAQYDGIAQKGVPDEFTELLKKADKNRSSAS